MACAGKQQEELAKEACRWRNACQRKNGNGKHPCQHRICFVKSFVIMNAFPTCGSADNCYHAKSRKVGKKIDQDEIYYRSTTHLRAATDAHKNKTYLCNGRKG